MDIYYFSLTFHENTISNVLLYIHIDIPTNKGDNSYKLSLVGHSATVMIL